MRRIEQALRRWRESHRSRKGDWKPFTYVPY